MRPQGGGETDVHLVILDRLDATRRGRGRRRRAAAGRTAAPGHVTRLGTAVRAQLGALRRLGHAAVLAPAQAAGAAIFACRWVVFATCAPVRRAAGHCAATAHAASAAIAGAQRSSRTAAAAIAVRVAGGVAAARSAVARAARSVVRGACATLASAARGVQAGASAGSAALGVCARLLARPPRALGRAARRGAAKVRETRRSTAEQTARAAVTARAGGLTAARAAAAGGARSVTAGPRALGPSTYAAGAVALVLVLAATLGQPEYFSVFPGAMDELRDIAGPNGPAAPLLGALAALRDPSLPEEQKLAIVADIARDSSNAATDILLSAARNASVPVSMASMRALRGRPCDRMGAPLARHLSRRDWQRRAWAAKVLGENGCAAAAPALRSRLMRERDVRVRRQLAAALATLIARAG